MPRQLTGPGLHSEILTRHEIWGCLLCVANRSNRHRLTEHWGLCMGIVGREGCGTGQGCHEGIVFAQATRSTSVP